MAEEGGSGFFRNSLEDSMADAKSQMKFSKHTMMRAIPHLSNCLRTPFRVLHGHELLTLAVTFHILATLGAHWGAEDLRW